MGHFNFFSAIIRLFWKLVICNMHNKFEKDTGEKISRYCAHKWMLTPTPPNFKCNSPPFLMKIKRRAKKWLKMLVFQQFKILFLRNSTWVILVWYMYHTFCSIFMVQLFRFVWSYVNITNDSNSKWLFYNYFLPKVNQVIGWHSWLYLPKEIKDPLVAVVFKGSMIWVPGSEWHKNNSPGAYDGYVKYEEAEIHKLPSKSYFEKKYRAWNSAIPPVWYFQ